MIRLIDLLVEAMEPSSLAPIAQVLSKNIKKTDKFGGNVITVTGGRRGNEKIVVVSQDRRNALKVVRTKRGFKVLESAGVARTSKKMLLPQEVAELIERIFVRA